jgi:RimJ/RimL family protein N-acetyltransferase
MGDDRAAFPVIKTVRLKLRPPHRLDAPAMASLANDIDVARMTTHVPHPYAQSDAEAFIARMDGRDGETEVLFALENADGALAGLLGFHPTPAGPEIGYWLGRPFWGLGLATEAVCAVLSHAAGAWGRRFVVSGHFDDNQASGRVLIKAGFLYTGEVQSRWSVARNAVARTRMMIWLA